MTPSAQEDARLIKQICDREQIQLAVAESVSVGYLQSLLAATPGASTFFRGGATTYSIHEKTRLLKVDPIHAASVNCVSQQVTTEMARGVVELFNVQIGIATTGYAESLPGPGSLVLRPYAYYVIWDCGIQGSGLIQGGERGRIACQAFYAETALNKLRLYMEARYGLA
jgi:nicotinamide-nucleotide amidase